MKLGLFAVLRDRIGYAAAVVVGLLAALVQRVRAALRGPS